MHTVRKHILELLKENESATVAELASRLEMPAVSVRHHLDILQGDNLICVDRLERKGNVGRPQQVYALTTEAAEYFPDNFAALAAGLVRQLKNVLPPAQVEAAFHSMAADLAAEIDPDTLARLPMDERLARVAEFLTARGYLARWEEDDTGEGGGFLLHKCNCPYADVAEDHPELCLMDQALMDQLLGQTCVRTHSMANSDRCCTYQIQGDQMQGDEIQDGLQGQNVGGSAGGCMTDRQIEADGQIEKTQAGTRQRIELRVTA